MRSIGHYIRFIGYLHRGVLESHLAHQQTASTDLDPVSTTHCRLRELVSNRTFCGDWVTRHYFPLLDELVVRWRLPSLREACSERRGDGYHCLSPALGIAMCSCP